VENTDLGLTNIFNSAVLTIGGKYTPTEKRQNVSFF
jgi:hypothetical protein